MLTLGLMLLWFAQTPASTEPSLIHAIAQSGRISTVAESDDERVAPSPMIPPGQPPLLSFRYYEGQLHHRYGNADLMLDDAGH